MGKLLIHLESMWRRLGGLGTSSPVLVPAGAHEVTWKDAAGTSRTKAVQVETGTEAEVLLD